MGSCQNDLSPLLYCWTQFKIHYVCTKSEACIIAWITECITTNRTIDDLTTDEFFVMSYDRGDTEILKTILPSLRDIKTAYESDKSEQSFR